MYFSRETGVMRIFASLSAFAESGASYFESAFEIFTTAFGSREGTYNSTVPFRRTDDAARAGDLSET